MRIIKPGKLGAIPGGGPQALKRKTENGKVRDVWDDYAPGKSQSKKKEYTKGAGNRMVPRTSTDRGQRPGAEAGLEEGAEFEGAEGERYEPRSDYEFLEEQLGIKFQDHSLLSRSLTHRSALGLRERADYERLEFLGDAVLDLSVAHLLSDLHPEAREGELSKMRAALVNTQALAEIAKQLGLGPFVRLGRGELSSGGAERPSILADVMEAVIGAVYRDSSFEVALDMIRRIFGTALEEVTPFDPKTELQEALHAAGSEPPGYLLELVEGPEHAPTFVTVVVIDGQVVGRGRGTTKKAAQQEAAAQALVRMLWDTPKVELAENQRVFAPSAILYEHEINGKRRPPIGFEEPAAETVQDQATGQVQHAQ